MINQSKSARWVAMSLMCILVCQHLSAWVCQAYIMSWIFVGWCWHVTWCLMTGSFGTCFFRPCKVPMELRGVWRWRRTAWRWMGENLWRLRARMTFHQGRSKVTSNPFWDPRFRLFTRWMQLVTLNCPLHHNLRNYVSTMQLWLQLGRSWDEAMEQRANELETEVMDLQRCLHLAQSQAWQGTRHVGMGWMGKRIDGLLCCWYLLVFSLSWVPALLVVRKKRCKPGTSDLGRKVGTIRRGRGAFDRSRSSGEWRKPKREPPCMRERLGECPAACVGDVFGIIWNHKLQRQFFKWPSMPSDVWKFHLFCLRS